MTSFTESDYADVFGENQGSSADLEIKVDFRYFRKPQDANLQLLHLSQQQHPP